MRIEQYIDPIEQLTDYKNTKVIKKVFNGTEWEDVVFIRLSVPYSEHINTVVWLKKYYGKSVYAKTWWHTHDGLWVNDKIYVHWKLCE